MSILPLGGLAAWAMNQDIDFRVAMQRTGYAPLDFLEKELKLTPSQVAFIWQELSLSAQERGFERIGLEVTFSVPYEMFRRVRSHTEYLGMESILFSGTVNQAIERYAAFVPMRHEDASLRIAVDDELVSVVWNLGQGDPGPHHTDFCVALMVATLSEALGSRLQVLRVGLGSDEKNEATERLFGDAELIASETVPFIELTRGTYELRLSDNYPVVGESLDRRLGISSNASVERAE